MRFGIYKNGEYHDRLFPYDPVPRIIESDEYDELEKGLKQRVNALNAKRDAVQKELKDAGIHAEATPYSPWGLRVQGKPALTRVPAFVRGAIEVQDEGSQLLALLLDAKRGEMVVDFCAGAGGKTLLLGALNHLRERRIAVPGDMALIGFDEFDWAALLDPPVTVLDERSEEIGRIAAQTLTKIITAQSDAEMHGETAYPLYTPEYQLQVPAALIVRQSCGCGHGRSILTPHSD